MRIVRWILAATGCFAALAAAWYAAAHIAHLGDGASWAIAGTASAVALAVLSWWAARDPAAGPPDASPVLAAAASGHAQVATGDHNILIRGAPGATINLSNSPLQSGPLTTPAPAGPAVAGEVPGRPPAFQARDQLLAPLRDPGAGPGIGVIHAITGMRGTGKTQLAAAYARQAITDQWRLVGWINADTPAAILNGLAEAAAALGILPGDDQDATARALRRYLETSGDGCLLVFDNAPGPGLLRPYLPAAGHARILITSTSQATTALGTPISVDVFTEPEALAYLHERTGSDDIAGARELAAELGHLPLALAQAAAVITTQRLDYPVYLHRLRTTPVGDYLTPTEEDPYPHGAAAAILLALHAATGTDTTGLARLVMNLAALLSPAGIPRTLVHTAVGLALKRQPQNRQEAEVLDKEAAAVTADAVLAHLAGPSLLTFSLDRTTVSAHRLVTRVVREQLTHDHTLLEAALAAVHALDALTQDARPVWQHPQAAKGLIQQITALHSHLPPSPDTRNELHTTHEELLKLRGWALQSLDELDDNPAQAIDLGQQLTTDREQILGPDHPDTLDSRGDLAFAYESAGRLGQAIPLYEQTLADTVRVLGPDHPNTLITRNNLAYAYKTAGRLGQAIPLFEQTLTDRERVLGLDHPSTLTSRNNLANAYESAGRLGQAIPLFEQTLTDRERVLGLDHPSTLTSRNNLANAYQAAGRLGQAIPLHERNLADSERVLGHDHPHTLTTGTNLAGAYQAAGRLGQAIPLFEQTLADSERVLGHDHPNTLTSQNSLAGAYQAAGRLGQAIPLFERNLADRERVLGLDHPRTLTSQNSLADAYQAAGRLGQAIPLFERNLADRERVLGPDHPDTLTARRTVADLRRDST